MGMRAPDDLENEVVYLTKYTSRRYIDVYRPIGYKITANQMRYYIVKFDKGAIIGMNGYITKKLDFCKC